MVWCRLGTRLSPAFGRGWSDVYGHIVFVHVYRYMRVRSCIESHVFGFGRIATLFFGFVCSHTRTRVFSHSIGFLSVKPLFQVWV